MIASRRRKRQEARRLKPKKKQHQKEESHQSSRKQQLLRDPKLKLNHLEFQLRLSLLFKRILSGQMTTMMVR